MAKDQNADPWWLGGRGGMAAEPPGPAPRAVTDIPGVSGDLLKDPNGAVFALRPANVTFAGAERPDIDQWRKRLLGHPDYAQFMQMSPLVVLRNIESGRFPPGLGQAIVEAQDAGVSAPDVYDQMVAKEADRTGPDFPDATRGVWERLKAVVAGRPATPAKPPAAPAPYRGLPGTAGAGSETAPELGGGI